MSFPDLSPWWAGWLGSLLRGVEVLSPREKHGAVFKVDPPFGDMEVKINGDCDYRRHSLCKDKLLMEEIPKNHRLDA